MNVKNKKRLYKFTVFYDIKFKGYTKLDDRVLAVFPNLHTFDISPINQICVLAYKFVKNH